MSSVSYPEEFDLLCIKIGTSSWSNDKGQSVGKGGTLGREGEVLDWGRTLETLYGKGDLEIAAPGYQAMVISS